MFAHRFGWLFSQKNHDRNGRGRLEFLPITTRKPARRCYFARGSRIYIYESLERDMPKTDPKSEALARDGALNPNPDAVHDPLFTGNPFFDPKDTATWE
jgi:hypothetical protein